MEFLARLSAGTVPLAALCREYGISRKTAYKWKHRADTGDSLSDRSRRPKTRPNATPAEVVSEILAIRSAHPGIGGGKISIMLKRRGVEGAPAGSTVTDILRRHDMLDKRATAEARHYVRFSKENPNDMWQVDFKGHFPLANGERCHQLNMVDDCSRYAIASVPVTQETFAAVKPPFEDAFRTYGLPETLLCDNGNPWGVNFRGISVFEVWAMSLGVLVIHGRPLHPQTQGKEERFNKTWKREVLERLGPRPDILDVLSESETFRDFYNFERPHFGIGGRIPGDLYRKSPRPFPESIPEWTYPRDMELSYVDSNGYTRIRGVRTYIGEAFGSRSLGFRESRSHEGCVHLFFREFRIGRLNLKDRRLETLRAYRIEGDPRMPAK